MYLKRWGGIRGPLIRIARFCSLLTDGYGNDDDDDVDEDNANGDLGRD